MEIINTLKENSNAKAKAIFKHSHIPNKQVEGKISIQNNSIYILQNEIDGNDAKDMEGYECSFVIAYHNETDEDVIDNDDFTSLEIEVNNKYLKLI